MIGAAKARRYTQEIEQRMFQAINEHNKTESDKQALGKKMQVKTSLLIIRYPCPSIMYEIIIMVSYSASGNFRGSFVVSISNAHT